MMDSPFQFDFGKTTASSPASTSVRVEEQENKLLKFSG